MEQELVATDAVARSTVLIINVSLMFTTTSYRKPRTGIGIILSILLNNHGIFNFKAPLLYENNV